MKLKIFLIALAAAMATTTTAQTYHYESIKGDPMQARIYTMPNGLKVYLSVNKEKPRLQTYIAVRTGSRNDPAETTGLAHYLEHLMFKGTTHFGSSNVQAEAPFLDSIQNRYERYRLLTDPEARNKAYHEIDSISQLAAQYNIPNEYDKLMAAIGSEGTNAYTSNDVTCYVEDIPSNEIDTWARIQADRFRNMVIRGFHTELEAVYEEYNIGLTNDMYKSWTALNKLLYPNHPYGTQTTIGTQDHLKNPSIVNIKNYYKRYYVPNNIAICMAGDFDPDSVIAIIDKYFGDWKPDLNLSRPEYAPIPQTTHAVDTTFVGQEAEYLMMGWRTKGAASYQADTLRVIAAMLHNGMAGLFDANLNTPMKLQEAEAFYEGMHDYGNLLLVGLPKQGQTPETVKSLMLAEIEKLKKGQFPDNLLHGVVNNMKLAYYQSLQSNKSRADKFVDAFVSGRSWQDQVNTLARISKMTKAQIVAFANNHLLDNYALVYKTQGTDTTLKKIDKPAITPIPTNNDMQSDFLKEIVSIKAEPIRPQFADFSTDLRKRRVDDHTKMLYKGNTNDDLFRLEFDFPIGHEVDNRLDIARTLLNYAGTKKRGAADVKAAFYDLACDFSVRVGKRHTRLALTGLNENMPTALRLFVDLLQHATIDKTAYNNAVNIILKEREDSKQNQRENFMALQDYGTYGPSNPTRNSMTADELRKADGNDLLRLLANLRHHYPMTIMYYGPTAEKDMAQLVGKCYPRKKITEARPQAKMAYKTQVTPKTEVLLAPYDAKNIYMVQYHNENRTWTPENAAINALFNEYFGGGMNAVVFQEMREARGLAYSANAGYDEPTTRQDPEAFHTFVITQSDKMMDCINEFNKLINAMPARPAAFDLARRGLMKSLSARRITRFNLLNYYMQAQDLGLDYDIARKIYQQLPSLTLDDLVRFASERIANKPYKYLILGDEKNLDIPALEKIAPIRRISTEQLFGY